MLAESFPSLFAVVGAPSATIAQYFDAALGGGIWAPTFRRNLSQEELVHLGHLLNFLTGFSLATTRDDTWRWRWEEGDFSVKSTYQVISEEGVWHFCAL